MEEQRRASSALASTSEDAAASRAPGARRVPRSAPRRARGAALSALCAATAPLSAKETAPSAPADGAGRGQNHVPSARTVALAGSAASFAVTCFCHPIDTLKTIIQHDKRSSRNLAEQLLRILRERGVGGLYAGMPSNLLSSMPISAIYTSSYETFKRLTLPLVGERQALAHCAGGAMASVCTSFVYTPCEVFKNRMQVGQYTSSWECVVGVLRAEGVGKLYAGWGAVLCRNVPQSIIKFFTYEQLKRRLEAETKSGLLPAHRQQLATGVAGGTSACTAAFFSHAFDTIKTRIMTGTLGIETRNPIVALRHVVRTEGFFALYRGLAPRLFIYATQGAIFFGSYETLKLMFSTIDQTLNSKPLC